MNTKSNLVVDPGPESIAGIALAPCHENGRGGLDPSLGRNATATGPAPAAAAAAAATREVGTVLEIGAENDPRGGINVPIQGSGATFMLEHCLCLLMLRV